MFCFVCNMDLFWKALFYSITKIFLLIFGSIVLQQTGIIEVNCNNLEVSTPTVNDLCDEQPYTLPDFRGEDRRISEVKCLEYLWDTKYIEEKERRIKICSGKRRNIIGGTSVPISQYAHMGAIGWISSENPNRRVFKCGASLISDKYMLTAAHCSRLPREDRTVANSEPSIVRLSDEYILRENSDRIRLDPLDYFILHNDETIQRFIVHEKYQSPRKYYDIALIELQKKVSFNIRIRPACLWNNYDTSRFSRAYVTGWGINDIVTHTTTSILQAAEIELIENTKCDEILESKFNRNWNGTSEHQLCAGHLAGGIDSCQGDSGGPLQHKIQLERSWPMHYLIGITSFGHGCGRTNMPGVYTRVASFIDWIEQNVWN